MRGRTKKPESERQHAAAGPAARAVGPRAARLLALQRAAGNQAVARAISRVSGPPKVQRFWDWDDVVDFVQWTNPLTVGQKAVRHFTGAEVNVWQAAELIVRQSASRISIPQGHVDKLKQYARDNPDDGRKLLSALEQGPKHYQGGILVGGNKDAEAITFGNSVFYGDASPSVATYVHEMVHIHQYRTLGRTAFLASYFGLSLATIAGRLMRGKAPEVMRSSPHEEEAYNLEQRFKAWHARNP